MLLMASFPPPMMNDPSYDRGRSSSSSSYDANINPPGRGAFRGPTNAGNGAANFARNGNANDNLDGGGVDANGVDGREGAGRPRGGGGLGAIASGAASNERYNRDDVRRRRQRQRGGGMGGGQSPGRGGGGDGYYSSSNAGPTPRSVGGGPGYGPRATGPGSVGGGGIGGGDTFETDMRRQQRSQRGGDGPPLPMRPPGGGGGGDNDPRINPNLRYEESDYSEYVKRLRRTSGVVGPPGPLPPPPGGMRDLEEEVVRLRTENALLKRSCQDMMNNFNELSNRLFDVDECLKKVAKVFPSEDEMESLEWLMRR